jgi:hypothetical protein
MEIEILWSEPGSTRLDKYTKVLRPSGTVYWRRL